MESSRKVEKSGVACIKSRRQEGAVAQAADYSVLRNQMPLKEKTGQVVPCPA